MRARRRGADEPPPGQTENDRATRRRRNLRATLGFGLLLDVVAAIFVPAPPPISTFMPPSGPQIVTVEPPQGSGHSGSPVTGVYHPMTSGEYLLNADWQALADHAGHGTAERLASSVVDLASRQSGRGGLTPELKRYLVQWVLTGGISPDEAADIVEDFAEHPEDQRLAPLVQLIRQSPATAVPGLSPGLRFDFGDPLRGPIESGNRNAVAAAEPPPGSPPDEGERPAMLVTSRGVAEYRAMFSLTDADLRGRVLDCSSGAASLVAYAGENGGQAVGCDPVYSLDSAQIRGLVAGSVGGARQHIVDNPERFSWRWYGAPENRAAMRSEAAAAFFADRARNPGRYIAGALPDLPFADGAFDLALCSCLLFTWVSRLDEAWHRAALMELARVAAQVRVYPLVAAGAGEPVPFFDHLLGSLRDDGYQVSLQPVEYEFQVGAGHMLVLSAPRS